MEMENSTSVVEETQAKPEVLPAPEPEVKPEISPEVEACKNEIERIMLKGNKKDFHDRLNFGFIRKLLPKILAGVDPMTGVSNRRKSKSGTSYFDPIMKKPVRPGHTVWTVQGYDLGLESISSEALVLAAENPAIKKLVSPNEISNAKFVGGGNFDKKSLKALEGLKAKLEAEPRKKQEPKQKQSKPVAKKQYKKPKVERPKAQVVVPKATEETA